MEFKLQKCTFQKEYNNADSLLNDMFEASKSTEKIIYRGISRDKEKYPNIMRVWHNNEYKNIHYSKEISMLKDFRKYAASLIENSSSSIDFVSHAQHFGVPTRLLDWTTNPFVALFFSLSAPWVDDSIFSYRIYLCDKARQLVFDDLYYLRSNHDVAHQLSDIRIESFEKFTKQISGEETLRKLCEVRGISHSDKTLKNFILLEPNHSNPRLNAQQGLFIIPKTRDQGKIDAEYNFAGVETITINKNIRDEVLEKLNKLGYSTVRLFFDLQNIASYIKESALLSDK